MVDWDGGWGIVGWLGMGLMMISIWVIPIALVVWLVVRGTRNDRVAGTTSPVSHADAVLAERFAGGEIDEDEFNHRRNLLSSVGSGPS